MSKLRRTPEEYESLRDWCIGWWKEIGTDESEKPAEVQRTPETVTQQYKEVRRKLMDQWQRFGFEDIGRKISLHAANMATTEGREVLAMAMVATAYRCSHLKFNDSGEIPWSQSDRVILFSPKDQPLIDGEKQPRLTDAEFDVVLALIEAGDVGLTKDQLIKVTRRGGSLTTLKNLAKKGDWWSVLQFPGETGRPRYRIS